LKKFLITYLTIILIVLFTTIAYTQPYLQADAQENISEYKVLSYIDKNNSPGFDPNKPLFIDPNFVIKAESDGVLKFDLSGLEVGIVYYLRLYACYNGTCNNEPIYIVINRRPLPPTPLNVSFIENYLLADAQEGITSYKIISHIDPNNSPLYDPNDTLFLDPNITVSSEVDGSLNYDLTGLEVGITYSLQLFSCNNVMCGYPSYIIIYKDLIIPKPLNVSISTEGLYGKEFYFMVIR